MSRIKFVPAAEVDTRELLMASADERMDAARGQARVDLERHLNAAGVVPVKRRRRTKEEMKAVRAERAQKDAELVAASVPAWMREPDELFESILTSGETT
jgi:hypothetical protein